MFARATPAFVLALPILAAASAVPRNGGGGVSQCNTGPIQCCNTVQSSTSGSLASLLGLLGVVLGPIDALLAADCTPITVIGAGGNNCAAQPVCCTGNQFNGLINVGCSPININL